MNENKEIIEAEAVPTQAIAKREDIGLTTISALEQSFALAVRQRELLSEYIRKQLKPGKHFYQRGDQKPSLSKEGAEIILLPHNLAPDYEMIGGPDQPPEGDQPYQITVKCILRRKGDMASFVGSGIGSAGSFHRNRDGKYTPRQPDKYLCHNATLKMAQKSAMIAATINSTAASEFFTQDLEPGSEPDPPKTTPPPPPPKPKKDVKMPTEATRKWMIEQLKAVPGGENWKLCNEYFQKIGQLLPNETVQELPLRFVPFSKQELEVLISCLSNFEAGGDAVRAFEPHGEAEDFPGSDPAFRTKTDPEDDDAKSEPWYNFIVPIPHRGQKRADYVGNEDTIGSLYSARHDDEEARKRLWGFLNNYEPKGWEKRDGTKMPPSKTDIEFRAMLDKFGEWFEAHHPEEKL